MPKTPVIRPRELIRALKKLGFLKKRQKGSHLIMIHEGKNKQIVIPVHNKPLKKGTIGAILRQADVSVDDL